MRLTAAAVLWCPLVAGVGYWWRGTAGIWAGVAATTICCVGALVALAATGVTRGPQRALYAIVYSMVFGFGLPFLVGLLVDRAGGPLAEGGLFGLMVGCFELTLVVQTWLMVRLVQASSSQRSASGVNSASVSSSSGSSGARIS
jgi:hypothetical protein